MARLSIIMIVKNEGQCLGRCLDSVRGIADDILVADTGSTDETVSIAREHGARVIEIPWRNDFAEARNQSIAAAEGDWLLHLDADEVLDAVGADRIRVLVDADGFGADAVEITLANYCDEPRAWRWIPVAPGASLAHGYSGYIKTTLLRLFRNRCGFEYREPVHENITESVIEQGGRIRREEEIVIHHYGHDQSSSRSGAKAALYLEIARAKKLANPNEPKALHDFAEQALACGLVAEAEAACRHVLAIDALQMDSATTLANILLNRGAFSEARALLERLAEAGLRAPHVLTALGAIACREGRLESALALLDEALAASPGPVMTRLYLARVYDRFGLPDRARCELEVLSQVTPNLAEIQDRLRAHTLRCEGEGLVRAGKAGEALPRLVESLRLDAEDPLTHNALGVAAYALGETRRAHECFERALALAPGWVDAEANLRAVTRAGDSSIAR